MSFSTVLRLNDVDDYIAPAQNCINPINFVKDDSVKTKSIQITKDGQMLGISSTGTEIKLKKAQINLSDCLACSGCITTAENILINQHSFDNLQQHLKEKREMINAHDMLTVITIAPQCVASITSYLRNEFNKKEKSTICQMFQNIMPGVLSPLINDVWLFLEILLKRIGIDVIIDSTSGRHLSLRLCGQEFISRYNSGKLPVLAGICPGFVCYAEKNSATQNQSQKNTFSLVPLISNVRSPQQIIGGILKDNSCIQDKNIKVYHASVMPCFDKKLEASRSEFIHEDVKEVDVVLGTMEFIEFLEHNQMSSTEEWIGNSLLLEDIQQNLNIEFWKSHYRHSGSTSGGYMESVFHTAAYELFNICIDEDSTRDLILIRNLGNKDIVECNLFSSPVEKKEISDVVLNMNSTGPLRSLLHILSTKEHKKYPSPVLVFVVANGFRNIQNIVQKLKQWKTKCLRTELPTPFDYVEVMACPSGCANGGAQLRGIDLQEVEQVYQSAPILSVDHNEKLTETVYDEKLLFTTYRQSSGIEIINPSAMLW